MWTKLLEVTSSPGLNNKHIRRPYRCDRALFFVVLEIGASVLFAIEKTKNKIICLSSRRAPDTAVAHFLVHKAKIHACHQCFGIKTEQNEARGPDTCLAVREHQRNALSGMRAGKVGVFVWERRVECRSKGERDSHPRMLLSGGGEIRMTGTKHFWSCIGVDAGEKDQLQRAQCEI